MIHLPCFGITIRLYRGDSQKELDRGTITSDLKQPARDADDTRFNAVVDGLESLILAHACAGVDVESAAYIEGIETAVEAIGNNL